MSGDLKLICFDLDDTLWPCMPVIRHADDAIYNWLAQHKPQITNAYTQSQLREKRLALAASLPEQAHDLSVMRKLSLAELAAEFSDESDWINEAFEVFYLARQQVSFFDDVAPVLEQLRQDYQLAAVSNGNANIFLTPMAGYFDFAVSAAEAGAAKPEPAMFSQLQQKSGLRAEQMVHVGDHPVHDIEGAANAGIRSIWLNRERQAWSHPRLTPDYIIENLYELLPTVRAIGI